MFHSFFSRAFRKAVLISVLGIGGMMLLLGATAVAQAPEASLRGVVGNTQGQPLAGVRLTVTDADTGLVQTTTSDSEGRYSFGSLPRGLYMLNAAMEGYQSVEKRGIEMRVGSRLEEHLILSSRSRLSPESATDDIFQVVPPAASLPAETVASSVSVVIEENKILRLPLASRNVYSLFLLQPGVTSQGAIAARGLSLSVHGQRVSGSNYQLDGSDNNNIVLTGPVATASAEAVQEFRMVNSSFSAENGRATAFVAQVVTRSGSNRFHGSAFELLGNDKLNANTFQNDASGTAKSPLRQNQFGFSLGGPIRENRTFFWMGLELSHLRFGTLRNFEVPSSSFIAGLPADSVARRLLTEIPPYPSTPSLTNPDIGETTIQAPNRIDSLSTTQRLDHHFANEKDRLSFRYTLSSTSEQRNQAIGSSGVGTAEDEGIAYPRLVPTDRFRADNTLLTWTHAFNARRVNHFRAGWSREGLDMPRPRPEIAILESLDGVSLPSSERQSALRENNNVIEFSDTFSEQRGRSALRAGFELRRNLSSGLTLGLQNEALGGHVVLPDGLYLFDSLASFAVAQPLAFAIGVDPFATVRLRSPDLERHYRSNEFAAFLQDDVKLTARFSLNLGLRYEYYGVLHNDDRAQDLNFYFGPGAAIQEQLANGVVRSTDQNPGNLKGLLYRPDPLNLAPSIGIAWDPFGRGRSVVRAGYAIAFDRVLDTVRDLRSNNLQIQNCLSFLGCTAPLVTPASNTLAFLNPSLLLPSPYEPIQLDEHLHTPYAQNWYFGVQQTVTPNFLVEIGHSGSLGRKLLSRDIINRFVPGAARSNSGIGDDTFISNAGDSSYLAMEVGLRRRFSKGLQYQVSYTWSHAIDNQSDIFEGTRPDPRTGAFALSTFTREFDAQLDRGNANFDQRHNLVLNAIWELPRPGLSAHWLNEVFKSWTVSTIGAHRSGFPVTAIGNSLFADLGAGLVNNRLDFVGNPGQRYEESHPAPVPGGVQWLDPSLFQPAMGHAGNVGREAISGPGFWNYDLALLRDVPVAEGKQLQFRFEFYNILNHANLSAPVTTYLSDPVTGTPNPDFGKAYYGLNATHSRFGDLPLESSSRRIQLGLRIEF